MAKDSINLKLTKKELIKYVYAVECAIDVTDSHESPLLYSYLNELKNKLTNLNK
jgi:hypothetical protein